MNNYPSLITPNTSQQETLEKLQKQISKTNEDLELDQETLNSIYSELFRSWQWTAGGAWASFLTGNYPIIICASLLALLQSLKTQEKLKKLKEEAQIKSLRRIGIILEYLAQNNPVFSRIDGVSLNSRLHQLDYLLSPKNGKIFALSITTLLPNPKGFVQVSYDEKKQKLVYQTSYQQPKPKKPNYFPSDPIQQLTQDLEYIKKSQPNFANKVLTGILVLANPITLATLSDTYYQKLGSQRYLYINGIYIVEESRLITLLTSLRASEPTSEKLATSTSKKETQLSKPPIRLANKPSPKTPTKTPTPTTQSNVAAKTKSSNPITETTEHLSESEQDDLIRQIFPHIVEYIAFFSRFYLLFFRENQGKISLFALYFLRTTYGKTQIHKTGRILSLAIREETEYRLSSLLLEKMSRPGMTLCTHWNYPDDDLGEQDLSKMPDMILHLPPDLVFIISVKSLVSTKDQPVKVFYDPAVDTLRFRKGSRGKKNFPVDPLIESHQQVSWLLEHCRDLVPHKPVQIVVFANPIDLRHHKNTPVQFFGTKKPFMHHKDVYVVKENKLVQLVKALSPKPETVNN